MGSSKSQWYSKSLSAAKSNISTKLARRFEERQGKEICCNTKRSPSMMDCIRQSLIIVNTAVCVWVLRQNANEIISLFTHKLMIIFQDITSDNLDPKPGSSRSQDFNGLGMARTGHNKDLPFLLLTR